MNDPTMNMYELVYWDPPMQRELIWYYEAHAAEADPKTGQFRLVRNLADGGLETVKVIRLSDFISCTLVDGFRQAA